MLAKKEDFFGA